MDRTAEPTLDFVSKWLHDRGASGNLDTDMLAAIESNRVGSELGREALLSTLVTLADRGIGDAAH